MVMLCAERATARRWRAAASLVRAGVLMAIVAIGLATVTAPAQERKLTGQDVFALQAADDVQISPDGQHLLYVRTSEDIQTDSEKESLWLVEVASGAQRRVVAGEASSPRWSPDGTRAAYVASDAAGHSQIFVWSLDSGMSVRVSDVSRGPNNLSWSPDSASIAFTMFVPEAEATLGTPLVQPAGAKWATPLKVITSVRYRADGAGELHPGHTHVFVVSAAGGAARQVTTGPYNAEGTPSWTPDGRSLLFSSNHNADRERDQTYSVAIFEAQVATGETKQLTHRVGPDRGAAVSPGGDLIAYTGFDERQRGFEQAELYVMARDGSKRRVLGAAIDRYMSQPQWAADGRSVYVAYGDHGVGKVSQIGLDGTMKVVAEGMEDGAGYSVSKSGAIAFAVCAPDHPGDAAVTSDGTMRRMTELNAELLRGVRLGAVKPLAVRSSFDQRAIGGWMVLPPDYDAARRYPTILVMHGGPFGNYGPQWSTDFQLYAAAGYVVLYANPRGSTSYGAEFSRLINHNFPSHDYDDLMSVVDAAIAEKVADPKRLFVMGGSAGGELTAWIVGKTNRFRAAVAQKPVINAGSELLVDGSVCGRGHV